ncbi:MAG: hypothetical protein Q9157_006668 [Trypethelium eluteriae]
MKLILLRQGRPCYVGLRNNVPTSLMETKLNRWPDGTEDFVSHATLKAYIQETSLKTGVDAITIYNTSVERVEAYTGGWKVRTITLDRDRDIALHKKCTERDWVFDAVVVASGHYHACNVPDITGLSEAKTQWPSRIMHSKGYRRPDDFRNQNVLLIGAGVSSTDIARELGPIAGTIYQSSRGGQYDLNPELLPPNGHRIEAIESFNFEDSTERAPKAFQSTDPIPLDAILKNGHRISDIHRIIVCTGYHSTYPFLRQYHDDKADPASASDTVLVTDGTQIHNLHKDIFYIPDPSLAFVGTPYYTATFTLFEFQAIAVAAVFAGRAKLPDQASMRKEYAERIKKKGAGRQFHSLRGESEEVGYANSLVDWVNQYGGYVDGELVSGHTEQWHRAKEAHLEVVRRLRAWKPVSEPNSQ